MRKRKSKFNNHKTSEGDSDKEARRYRELLYMAQNGQISDLRRQVEYILIPPQKAPTGHLRAIKYKADFVYTLNGKEIVEDVKPTKGGQVSKSYKKTSAWREYMIKKKLMYYIHGIEIKEV